LCCGVECWLRPSSCSWYGSISDDLGSLNISPFLL
jgi:hypothetical protein